MDRKTKEDRLPVVLVPLTPDLDSGQKGPLFTCKTCRDRGQACRHDPEPEELDIDPEWGEL